MEITVNGNIFPQFINAGLSTLHLSSTNDRVELVSENGNNEFTLFSFDKHNIYNNSVFNVKFQQDIPSQMILITKQIFDSQYIEDSTISNKTIMAYDLNGYDIELISPLPRAWHSEDNYVYFNKTTISDFDAMSGDILNILSGNISGNIIINQDQLTLISNVLVDSNIEFEIIEEKSELAHLTSFGIKDNQRVATIIGMDNNLKFKLFAPVISTISLSGELSGNILFNQLDNTTPKYSIDYQYGLSDKSETISHYYGDLNSTNWTDFGEHNTSTYVEFPKFSQILIKKFIQIGNSISSLTFENSNTPTYDLNLCNTGRFGQFFQIQSGLINRTSDIVKYFSKENLDKNIEISHVFPQHIYDNSLIGYRDENTNDLIIFANNKDAYYFSKGIPHAWFITIDKLDNKDVYINGTVVKNILNHSWQTKGFPMLEGIRNYINIGQSNSYPWFSFKFVDNSPIRHFEFAEQMYGINRFRVADLHKSNIMSISIEGFGLNSDSEFEISNPVTTDIIEDKPYEEINSQIRKWVESSIDEVIQKLKPSSTMVWKYNWI